MAETRQQIVAAVRAFVADSFCDGRTAGLDERAGLVTSGIVDSAGVVQLVQFLERRFAIRIADEEVGLANFNALGAIADLVAAKLGGTPCPACGSSGEKPRPVSP